MKIFLQVSILTFVFLSLIVSASVAQTPALVKDGSAGWYIQGFNGWFTSSNGMLFFDATDLSTGEALWKSDGTDAGTVLVKDIYPGGSSGLKEFVDVNGTLFFQANDGTHGYELWKSDGTADGTVMVKDIWPGSSSSIIKVGTSYNGSIYFNASDGTNGYELWKSDGTDTGTVMVKDLNPGAGHGNPTNLVVSNGTLFFQATDGSHGFELWKSDGTAGGTLMVKDINSGTNNSGNSSPGNLIDINGTLFFTVTYSVINTTSYAGYQLWKSDGTTSGTVQVKGNIYSSPPAPSYFTNVNGTLFYSALTGANGTELWKSDGTNAGTVLVGDNLAAASSPAFLTNVNGTVFFQRYVDASTGYELWKSDGTDAGTVQVKDIYPGPGSSGPTYLANVNGELYFWATGGTTYGTEMWKSDGTDTGTVMVQDFYPGSGSSGAFPLVNVNGTWFFAAYPGLWKLEAGPTGVHEHTSAAPSIFSLHQNYPNPFNPSTSVRYSVAKRGQTMLKVYDVLGQEVSTLVNEVKDPGEYNVSWDASRSSSGVYFYRLTSGSSSVAGKMVLMK